MSTLWWLQPGWKDALCLQCGINIWKAGGDPDHGVCPDCFNQRWHSLVPPEDDERQQQDEEQE